MARANALDDLDLIVMDVRMPGTSGIEIARMIRDARWHVPILLITAFPDADLAAEASDLQLVLLPKPFRLDELSDTAIEVLMHANGVA